MTIRWGFLGAGSIARSSLAPAVHAADGAQLQAVAARDAARAAALSPAGGVYSSYPDLLADPSVDAVYIALHTSAHRHWAEQALTAGKHVLCEKPLALTAPEVADLADVAARQGRVLTEACWNRWHPRTRQAEALIAAGAIGQVRHVTARFAGMAPAPDNFRTDPGLGGGALLDVGCYAVSGVLAAFGWQEPRVVAASADLWWPGSADRAVRARLEFPDGGTADVDASLAGDADELLRVEGTLGSLQLEHPAFTAGRAASGLSVVTPTGTTRHEHPAVDPYRLMVQEYGRQITGQSGWVVPLAQSELVARVLDAIRAHLDGRRS